MLFWFRLGVYEGAAQFTCAKIVEGSGVYASAQDLEEWNHVESMAYPLNYPVLVLAAPGPCLARAVKLAETCKRVGHPVLAVTDQACDAFDGLCDARFPIYAPCSERAAALYYALPGAALAHALAAQNGRAMFLSDQDVKLF